MSLRVLGVAGSLRRGSFNRALLRAATELAPDGMAITIFDGLAAIPPGKSVLNGKPAAIMGATPGATGTTRAQLALRQNFVFTNTCALLQPEVLVARVHEKIDAAGRVTDAATRELVAQLLAAFADWVPRVGTAAGATGAS